MVSLSQTARVNLSIIAATNCNLEEMTAEKTFRKDLFYRLKEGYLYLPPLSQHKEDIPLLVTHWMNTLAIFSAVDFTLEMQGLCPIMSRNLYFA